MKQINGVTFERIQELRRLFKYEIGHDAYNKVRGKINNRLRLQVRLQVRTLMIINMVKKFIRPV